MKNNNAVKMIFIIIVLFFMIFNAVTFATYELEGVTYDNTIEYKEVVNNREPRIQFKKNDKDYLYIYLHDNSGIQTDKSYFIFENNKIATEKLEHSNGAYTEGGKRYEMFEKGQYTGKRFDYGIKIKNSDLSTKYKNIFVFSYDYWGGCFIKETFKVKKYDKANKDGLYYQVDCAPRVSVKLENGKPKIYAIDYSGIKSINIVSEKTKEVVYSYSAPDNNVGELSVSVSESELNQKTEKKGYVLKDGVYYPIRINEEIDMSVFKKAGVGNERYKIRVTSEDKAGIKNEKTMISRISSKKQETEKVQSENNSSNNNSTNTKNTTNTSKTANTKNTTNTSKTTNTNSGNQKINYEYAVKVTSDAHSKSHENLPWHGSTVGKHAGMIGAYVEAINILNNSNYTLKEVYNKIIKAHPEQKSKNVPVYENEDINDYYNIKVTRASASVSEIKKALDQGKLVAEIVNTTKWRNEKGELFGKSGRHTGLIFYYDGNHYHMKTTVKKNAIYTEKQLKEWLGNTKTKLIIYGRK